MHPEAKQLPFNGAMPPKKDKLTRKKTGGKGLIDKWYETIHSKYGNKLLF